MRDFAQLEWNETIADDCRQLVRLAVREDLERGQDWTTVSLVAAETPGRAVVVARQAGVAAGIRAAEIVIEQMDPRIKLTPHLDEGATVQKNSAIATLEGPARSMLTVERPLLNFLGHLSGVATLTQRYVDEVSGTGARIYDTRKTTPGWRRLEKYAVRCGGGHNHRTGLYDAILIKDNHLALSETPAAAVLRVRRFLETLPDNVTTKHGLVEVEVDSIEQLQDALPAQPDIVLLDNMSLDQLRQCVALRNKLAPQIELEASGGVNLQTVRGIAETGVERISVGALTHSATWFDVGLDWQQH
jgi:nicotinate-nucleotide pyrophosphorylase (carboxylating)